MRIPVIFCAVLVAAACSSGSDNTTGPANGTIHITTATSGPDGDVDGYMYAVDGGVPVSIASTGSASVSLPAGSHTVALLGLSSNCTSSGALSLPVAVTGGQIAHADFAIVCDFRYSVLAATTGANPDIAYLVSVDAGYWQLIGANGPALGFTGLALGNHTLHIAGIAPNCVLTGAADRTITVINGTKVEPVAVVCSAHTIVIGFGSTRDGGHDLYTMHTDGGSVGRVTSGSPAAKFGRYSPDGTKIVYQSPVGTGSDIVVMDMTGANSVPLTTDGSAGALNRWPDWSPLGDQIVYNHGNDIWIMNADGTLKGMLRHDAYHPRFSPDGNFILFDTGTEVWIMAADFGENAHVVIPLGTGYAIEPSWSPDGKKILFISPRDGAFTDIFSANLDGTGITNLTHGAAGDQNADQDYSPDGTMISYRCNPNSGTVGICLMDANGANRVNILADDQDDSGTTWWP